MNFTRMHLFTHVRASMRGQSGMPDNEYADGMIEMDINVGKLMKALKDLRITDNTFVVFTTEWPQPVQLARCRYNSLPQRKKRELGRCIPGSCFYSLAWSC